MVGVTAKAELKSLVGLAAVVKRGDGQLIIVDETVHLYAPEYIGTFPIMIIALILGRYSALRLVIDGLD